MADAPADWTEGQPALLVSRCGACGHAWYLRRDACPVCGSIDVQRLAAAGAGVVSASTTVHRVVAQVDDGSGPIGIALVDLDEGVRVMARCTPGIRIGARVQAAFITAAGANGAPALLPCFEVTHP